MGDHPRNRHQFYYLIPQIPLAFIESRTAKIPLFMLLVTLFPNFDILIAFSILHILCDFGPLLASFKVWDSIYKFNGDTQILIESLLPFYDKSIIKQPYNLLEKNLNNKKKQGIMIRDFFEIRNIFSKKVRATFVLRQKHIKNLIKYVLFKRPNIIQISGRTVTCAYFWIS